MGIYLLEVGMEFLESIQTNTKNYNKLNIMLLVRLMELLRSKIKFMSAFIMKYMSTQFKTLNCLKR